MNHHERRGLDVPVHLGNVRRIHCSAEPFQVRIGMCDDVTEFVENAPIQSLVAPLGVCSADRGDGVEVDRANVHGGLEPACPERRNVAR